MTNNSNQIQNLKEITEEEQKPLKEINFDNYKGNNTTYIFRPIHRGSLRASVCGLICVTLGSGMLPLPYFFKSNGIVLTLIIFMLCSFSTLITLKLLINIARKREIYSYNNLVASYFGKNSAMEIYSIIVSLINSLGSIIAWNALIKKFTFDILNYCSFKKSELYTIYIMLFILICIQIPVATFSSKATRQFSAVSIIGIVQILYVITILLIEFPKYFMKNFSWELLKNRRIYINFSQKLIEMPLIFFIAFGNHSTILSVINEISNKQDEKRVIKAGTKTFYSEFIIYLIVMFASFFSTFDRTSEVFLDRPNVSLLMIIGEFLMLVLMICNIALYYYMMLPLLEMFFNKNEKFNYKSGFLAAFTILTLLLVSSLFVDRIINIFSFIGATAQVSLIFILPLSLYIRDNKESNGGKGLSLWKVILISLAMGVFSFIGLMCFIHLIIMKFVKL